MIMRPSFSKQSDGTTLTSSRGRAWLPIAAFSAAAALTAGTATATIVAVFPTAVLFTPPSVMPGVATAPAIWAFDEQQNVILPANIPVDIQPINFVETPLDLNPGVLLAGTCVSSHYLYYEDPVTSAATGGA